MMDYATEIVRVLGSEGAYSFNPDDPGGETKWGVTWPTLHQAIGMGLLHPDTTIKALTRDQAVIIYKPLFYDAAHLDEIDAGVAFQALDFAVNSGIQTALRALQRAVGVAEDGRIGPVTLAALRSHSTASMNMLLLAERLDFWRKLSIWAKFGAGWAGRAAQDLRYAAADNDASLLQPKGTP